jgi:hypothetical protein
MDEFSRRLKADAANIKAAVSAELEARIDASIQSVDHDEPVAVGKSRPLFLWWVSSLTGLTAAVLVIAFLNRNATEDAVEAQEASAAIVVPEYVQQLNVEFLLRAENADFTEPLEDELDKLKSDMAKAGENIRKDLRTTL